MASGSGQGTTTHPTGQGSGQGSGSGQSSGHGTPHIPVLISHATHSASNPWVPIVTDDDSVITGHQAHSGDRFITTGVPSPNDKAGQLALCELSSVTPPPGGTTPPPPAGNPPPFTG